MYCSLNELSYVMCSTYLGSLFYTCIQSWHNVIVFSPAFSENTKQSFDIGDKQDFALNYYYYIDMAYNYGAFLSRSISHYITES